MAAGTTAQYRYYMCAVGRAGSSGAGGSKPAAWSPHASSSAFLVIHLVRVPNLACIHPPHRGIFETMTAAADSHADAADDAAAEFWLYGYGYVVLTKHSTPSTPPWLRRLASPLTFLLAPPCRSLIWKPPPHFDRRIPGYVTGYVRRFWQPLLTRVSSEDHRGTPEAPGRVVTLIERSYWEDLTDHHDAAPEKVWGVAYRITPDKVAEVKDYLDIREINGYSIHYTPFQPADSAAPPIRTLVYIGTPDNAQFVGPQDPQQLAEHIFRSRGPSGWNKDYLLGLDVALEELSPESGDEHVADLARRVRALEKVVG
ncbi:ChaC-like protein [Cordyceps militaris CM01]|uniref:glutathione-specific gamma-glutamylcyclotransferase n=1 Tax=Cordyceps militaris (strain CM01) TaxID=983644 RepID=G3JK54_CORMM|nr:ChaC-like protein [Cordyceps militaris CM01]EGX92184.1 ChaC-like protein [Cordyceps militaris CM01]